MRPSLSRKLSAVLLSLTCAAGGALRAAADDAIAPLRPPAVPLVTHDPYFSVWSEANLPTDKWTAHWTGKINAMAGLVRIDGKAYRFLGPETMLKDEKVEPMDFLRLEVTATRTTYRLKAQNVALSVEFLSPLLPNDLDVLSRPVTYVRFEANSTDGQQHDVKVYLDITGEWAVNKPDQEIVWGRDTFGDVTALHVGTKEQPVLAKKGDDLRIDWGYAYLAVPTGEGTSEAVNADVASRKGFVTDGTLAKEDDKRQPRKASDDWPVLAATIDFGKLGEKAVAKHAMIAYDDQFSIEYFQKHLRPWWRRNGMDASQLLQTAEKDYPSLRQKCEAFDQSIAADLKKAGGEKYERLATLCYRESVAAHKLVASEDGKTPLFFSKENFSNGCIDTVDVFYPSAPLFLLVNPTLLKGQTTPILDYAAKSGRWKFPFAPHDLGTYPKANGQVYGDGERGLKNQMPVEETGNMMILLAAIAKVDGNAKYAEQYWPTITQWAQYLKEKGLDPENQLCTDDFAGHLAHNTNLSIKAIVALGGYAQLCEALGKADEAKSYRDTAKQMAAKWVEMAKDGDHYKLTFDKPGTWSQKYNLVWDKLLGMNLFPPDVAKTELAYYKTKLNPYGLPLDSRKDYTKLDWEIWTATMADNQGDFETFVAPIYDWLNATDSRVPVTDWYDTKTGKKVGFQARSVVGGVYIKLLEDPAVWKKWAGNAGASAAAQ